MVCFIQDLQYAKDQHTTVFMFNFRGLSIAKSLQARISLADRIWRKIKDLKLCPHTSYLPDAAMCMASKSSLCSIEWDHMLVIIICFLLVLGV